MLSKFVTKLKSKYYIFAATVLASGTASANDGPKNAAELAGTLQGQIGAFVTLALQFGFLIGTVFFLAGLFLLYKDSKQPGQDHAKKGFIALGVGSALMIAPTMMDVGTGTLVAAPSSNATVQPGG